MTRIFVCFYCGDIPCVLRCPDNCDMLPLCCPFLVPDEGGVVRPPWHEVRPVKPAELSDIIVGS